MVYFDQELQCNGLRTDAAIPQGTRIIEYTGQVYTRKQYQAKRRATPAIQHYTAQLDPEGKYFIDATTHGNEARFINHTCQHPNVFLEYTRGANGLMRIFVSTLHALKLHDKLLLKYDMDMKATDIQRVICKCPHGPEGHFLQGPKLNIQAATVQTHTFKEALLSNSPTHGTTDTSLLSKNAGPGHEDTQQGVDVAHPKRPLVRPAAPPLSKKPRRPPIPKPQGTLGDIRTFFPLKKPRVDVPHTTNPYNALHIMDTSEDELQILLPSHLPNHHPQQQLPLTQRSPKATRTPPRRRSREQQQTEPAAPTPASPPGTRPQQVPRYESRASSRSEPTREPFTSTPDPSERTLPPVPIHGRGVKRKTPTPGP